MSSTAVSFRDVSKHYRGAREYRALRDDLAGLGKRLIRKSPARARSVVRALDGVTFDIQPGVSTALLGLNGAGKSTSLKIMTRVTYPTAGEVRVSGRVGALIEVGSGMHPELTGRENVSLYGRIMGLTQRDIRRRFDEIVEFAGIERAIDQPVKHYSSGMQLRLGFSVAAHLEPDVLLVDEAISVGDAGFQYRCVERMSGLVREGRTLVFVSHDLSAVETLCQQAILLRSGRLMMEGPAPSVVRRYVDTVQEDRLREGGELAVSGDDVDIERVTLHDRDGLEISTISSGDPLTVRVHYAARRRIPRPILSLGLSQGPSRPFALATMLEDGLVGPDLDGRGSFACTFESLPLNPGIFEIWGSVRGEDAYGDVIDWQRVARFVVDDTGLPEEGPGAVMARDGATIRLPYTWDW